MLRAWVARLFALNLVPSDLARRHSLIPSLPEARAEMGILLTNRFQAPPIFTKRESNSRCRRRDFVAFVARVAYYYVTSFVSRFARTCVTLAPFMHRTHALRVLSCAMPIGPRQDVTLLLCRGHDCAFGAAAQSRLIWKVAGADVDLGLRHLIRPRVNEIVNGTWRLPHSRALQPGACEVRLRLPERSCINDSAVTGPRRRRRFGEPRVAALL